MRIQLATIVTDVIQLVKPRSLERLFWCQILWNLRCGRDGSSFEPLESGAAPKSVVLILARELVKGGGTIIFRFPDGKPAW